MDTLSVRQAVLADVQNALPVFEQINDLYLQAENLKQQVMVSHAKAEDGNARYGKVIAIIAAVLTYAVLDWIFRLLVGHFSGTVAFIYICVAIGIVVLVYRAIKKKDKAHREEGVQRVQDQLSVQMEDISREICRLFKENQTVILPIPRDYRNYNAVVFFESALANGRADNMKEALNLYEEYLHRAAMELNSQLALEQSRQQSAMLADIEESSRQAAVNSGIAAGFSVLNFLSNI